MKGTSVDAIFLTIVKVIALVISLACVKIVSVYFSLGEFGLYSQAMLIVTTVVSFTILGLSDGVNYYYNSDKSRAEGVHRNSYLTTIFLLQGIIGSIGAIAILAASPLLTTYFDNPALSATYIWIAFQPMLQNFSGMLQVLYISMGRTRAIVWLNLLWAVARLAIFLTAALYTGSVLTLIILTLVLDLAQVLIFVIGLRKSDYKFAVRDFTPSIIRPILNYAVPVAAFVIINALMRDTDKWVVGRLGSTDDLAIYTNASRVLPFDLMMTAFSTVLIPIITRFASSAPQKAAEVLGHYLNLGLFTTTILVGGALWLSRDFMLTLYDAKYLPGLGVFIVYLLVDLVRFANVSLVFNATGQTRKLLHIVLITFVVNLAAAVVLYKLLGLLGPAIATLLSMILSYAFYFYHGSKILKHSIVRLLNMHHGLILIAELCAVGGIILFIESRFAMPLPTIPRFFVLYALITGITALLNRKHIIYCLRQLNQAR